MEKWDLYTADRRLTGLEHTRGEPIPEGYYHLVVHVWIRGRGGNFLISQRSSSRPEYPLMWECVGGSALRGEDSLSAALREVREEIGLTLAPERGKLLFSETGRLIKGVKSSDILDVWLFEHDGDADLSAATTCEVARTTWVGREKIRELLDAGRMVHSLSYFNSKVW